MRIRVTNFKFQDRSITPEAIKQLVIDESEACQNSLDLATDVSHLNGKVGIRVCNASSGCGWT